MKLQEIIPFEELKGLVGEKGLHSYQVPEMREKYGANVMTPPAREPLWKQYLAKYHDPIIRILLIAVFLSVMVAIIQGTPFYDTLGIVLAILLATCISFYAEYRSGREFEILNAQREDVATKVMRDGRAVIVPSRDIVLGDRILLETGDAVPADGWLSTADVLSVDESTFTGESEPAEKNVNDKVLKGTFVTTGKGWMIAAAVGDSAQMGIIAASLGAEHATKTPLEQKLEQLARLISKFGYAMAILISGSLLVRGIIVGDVTGFNIETLDAVLSYFMIAVAIIVVAVPEGLPMSVTLSLSLTMRKMTRANCLVRRLIACETIGSATTICTDKTGTLTRNLMEVVAFPYGHPVLPKGVPKTSAEWITLNAAVNGTAYLDTREGKSTVVGNSTEGALLRWLQDHAINYLQLREETPVVKHYLFDCNRKRMSTVVEIDQKSYLLVKGAPEVCSQLCESGSDIEGINKLASRAMRCLAFAHKEIIDGDESESGLVWDGFVGIRDHLRNNIPESVQKCQAAGIRVRMITGDNPQTAAAIARESCILKNGKVITGEAFRSLSPEERVKVAQDLEVMARSEPMDKLLLVEALQKGGDVVAVTGDGTNDAPALKHADVGLSMGIAGTDVAREASDIILLDDSFASITNAVWWGRSLYENIQRFLLFQLTINIGACILLFIAPLLGYPAPFTITQILWINIIMDTLAAFALCSEIPHSGLMERPPISPDSPLITRFMWTSIIVMGAFFIATGLLQLSTGFIGGTTPQEIATVLFTAFVIAQVWNGFNCRALDGKMPPLFRGNPTFFVVMGLIVVLQVLIVQFGGTIFSTVPLPFEQWVRIAVLTASVLVVGLLIRVGYRYFIAPSEFPGVTIPPSRLQ
jgi:Ca2+-transporting ATPase